jgi:hypothetical protein
MTDRPTLSDRLRAFYGEGRSRNEMTGDEALNHEAADALDEACRLLQRWTIRDCSERRCAAANAFLAKHTKEPRS